MSAPPEEDPSAWAGPWAEDARRVFELLQGAAARYQQHQEAAGPPGEHPPECAHCPLCQGVALIRRSGPELLDRVAEVAAGLAATLRATGPDPGAAAAPGAPDEGDDPAPSAPSNGAAKRPPTTVRIDVTG
jgi:hypothetical protein